MKNFEFSEETIKSVAEKMIQERKDKFERLSSFIKQPIFYKIIRTIIDKKIFLDEENFRYFPEKVLSKFEIKELTEQDLNTFIEAIIDDELFVPQNTTVEEDNCFENTTSEKLGLKVFMMWGQGCCIQIFPASMNR